MKDVVIVYSLTVKHRSIKEDIEHVKVGVDHGTKDSREVIDLHDTLSQVYCIHVFSCKNELQVVRYYGTEKCATFFGERDL